MTLRIMAFLPPLGLNPGQSARALTAISLFNGITSMAHGGVEDDRRSYGLMCKRCLWQAVAVALVLIAMLAQLA